MSVKHNITIASSISSIMPSESDTINNLLSCGGAVTQKYCDENQIISDMLASMGGGYIVDVYSTSRESLYVQYPNNLIAPIQTKPLLNSFAIKKLFDTTTGKGVYVIETLNISSVPTHDLTEFLLYYAHARGIEYDEDVVNDINIILDKSKYTKNGCKLHKAAIKIITYVAMEQLLDTEYNYIPGPGIMITRGVPDDTLLHPFSNSYLGDTLVTPTACLGATNISVSIVDKAMNTHYIMVGNNPVKVTSVSGKETDVMPEGCTISIAGGNRRANSEYFALEKFKESGLYRSKADCITNGDKTLLLEESKYQLELKKLSLENERLVDSVTKLREDIIHREQLHRLEVIKKEDELERSATKGVMELTLTKAKTVSEIKLLGVQNMVTVSKLNAEAAKHVASMYKASLDIKLAKTSIAEKLVSRALKF